MIKSSFIFIIVLICPRTAHSQFDVNYSDFQKIIEDTCSKYDSVVSYICKSGKDISRKKNCTLTCKKYNNSRLVSEKVFVTAFLAYENRYEYNSSGRLMKASSFNNKGVLNSSVGYTYFGDSMIVAERISDKASIKGMFVFDSGGRLRREMGVNTGTFMGMMEHIYINSTNATLDYLLHLKPNEKFSKVDTLGYTFVDSLNKSKKIVSYEKSKLIQVVNIQYNEKWQPVNKLNVLLQNTNAETYFMEILDYNYDFKRDENSKTYLVVDREYGEKTKAVTYSVEKYFKTKK